MLPINNWAVQANTENPGLVKLVADGAVFNMAPEQARKIAAALITVAANVERKA